VISYVKCWVVLGLVFSSPPNILIVFEVGLEKMKEFQVNWRKSGEDWDQRMQV